MLTQPTAFLPLAICCKALRNLTLNPGAWGCGRVCCRTKTCWKHSAQYHYLYICPSVCVKETLSKITIILPHLFHWTVELAYLTLPERWKWTQHGELYWTLGYCYCISKTCWHRTNCSDFRLCISSEQFSKILSVAQLILCFLF